MPINLCCCNGTSGVPDDNTDACLCCRPTDEVAVPYTIWFWSNQPLFNHYVFAGDGTGDLIDSSDASAISFFAGLNFSCEDFVRNEDGTWSLDVNGDGSLILTSISASCPPIGPESLPGHDATSKWGFTSTDGYNYILFGIECCNVPPDCELTSDALFVDGLVGHMQPPGGTYGDGSGLPVWDGHMTRCPQTAPFELVGGCNRCMWSAEWVSSIFTSGGIDYTVYAPKQMSVALHDGSSAALTPMLTSGPYGWAVWFTEYGAPGSAEINWIKGCGQTAYGHERYPVFLEDSFGRAPSILSVSSGGM